MLTALVVTLALLFVATAALMATVPYDLPDHAKSAQVSEASPYLVYIDRFAH